MKQIFRILSVIFTASLLMVSCVPDNELIFPDDETEKPGDKDDDEDSPQTNPDYPDTSWATGELDWVFDMNELPEIRITVSEEQWNALLEEYDRNSKGAKNYINLAKELIRRSKA